MSNVVFWGNTRREFLLIGVLVGVVLTSATLLITVAVA